MRTRFVALLLTPALLIAVSWAWPASSNAALRPLPQPSFSLTTTTPIPAPLPQPSTWQGVQWEPAPCASGGIDGVHTESGGVIIAATISICGTWASKYAFTLVVFHPDEATAVARASGLRPYEPSGPTAVNALYLPFPISRPTSGVCLIRDRTTRLSCVRLDTTLTYQTTATPIAVDDPLVSRPVEYIDDSEDPRNDDQVFCGTCVQFPN